MSSKNMGTVMITTIYNSATRARNPREGVSIEALAAAANVTLKDAYSRLFWLEKREGKLVSTGKGVAKVYRLTAKTFKSLAAS